VTGRVTKAGVVFAVLLAASVLTGCAETRRLRADNQRLKEQRDQLAESVAACKEQAAALADENARLQNDLAAARENLEEKDSRLEEMRARLEERGFDASVRGGVVAVNLPTQILYPSGSAALSSGGTDKLRSLAGELKGEFSDFQIEVQGHTDTDPIRITKDKYRSNWELSYDRAQTVAYYLINDAGIDPERVHVGAYSKYQPVASNETEEGKAKNRRVEIVALKPAE